MKIVRVKVRTTEGKIYSRTGMAPAGKEAFDITYSLLGGIHAEMTQRGEKLGSVNTKVTEHKRDVAR